MVYEYQYDKIIEFITWYKNSEGLLLNMNFPVFKLFFKKLNSIFEIHVLSSKVTNLDKLNNF
jgi:hypothetical protein